MHAQATKVRLSCTCDSCDIDSQTLPVFSVNITKAGNGPEGEASRRGGRYRVQYCNSGIHPQPYPLHVDKLFNHPKGLRLIYNQTLFSNSFLTGTRIACNSLSLMP